MLLSKIVLDRTQLEGLKVFAAAAYPEECCGLLFGEFESDNMVKKLIRSKLMKNVYERSERHHRFTIDPKEFMEAEKEAEKMGQEVIGVFHSHPNAPAIPSSFDRNHAWPTLSYLVVEVRDRHPLNAASWVLKEDRSHFVEEDMEIVNSV